MSSRPEADDTQTTSATDDADVEGHGLPLVMGVNRLQATSRSKEKARADEHLPRLTKPFPRLKDDAKRG